MSNTSATTAMGAIPAAPSLDAAEFTARQQRAQAAMRDAGLDAVLVSEKYNYWYFTGHLSNEFDKRGRPMLLLIPADGRPVALVYGLTARALMQRCPGIECRTYEDVPFELSSLVELLDESGLAAGRIGMELGGDQRLGLAYQDVVELGTALPRAELVDAGPVVTALRIVKSAAEVEVLRHACRVSDRAWMHTLAAVSPGWDLADVKAELGAAICRAGADVNIAGHVDVRLGVPGRTVAEPGDVLWGDFGGTYLGYQSDIARRAVFGRASERDAAIHEQICELVVAVMDSLRPGEPASAAARACTRKLEQLGFPGLTPRKRIGHGVGLGPAEPPSLSLADETVLEPGMVVTVEPRFRLDDGTNVHLEEVVVITGSGNEHVSEDATVLRVIE